MKVTSHLLGEIEYDENEVIHFSGGLPGFEEEKQFLLIKMGPENSFYYLQSLQTAHLCMLLAEPFSFFTDYSIEIGDEELKILDFQGQAEELLIYVVLTIPEDYLKSTANLLAPLIINQANHKAMQYIASNSPYKTRHFLFPQEQSQIAASAQEG